MIILGINAYHGDAAAAIVRDGELIAAAEEERFNRIKHCAGFPTEAVRYCLRAAGVGIEDVDHIAISRDPSAHLHKKVLFAATRAARQVRGKVERAKGKEESVKEKAVEVLVAPEDDLISQGVRDQNGNGNGKGLFSQIRNRLTNAAKIRDLPEELTVIGR